MKKLLSLLMAFMLCLGVFTLVDGVNTVKAAEDDIASGTNGTCSWVIDADGVLTISPTDGISGTLSSYLQDTRTNSGAYPWSGRTYKDLVTKIIIQPGVKTASGCNYMFYGMSNCTEMDLSGLDTSAATQMYNMFSGCKKLIDIDLSSFDTSNVISMNGMFTDCSSLKSLDLSSFDTGNVIYFGGHGASQKGMFEGCSALISLDLSSFDTSNVTTMHSMFKGCSSLTSLDLSGFDTSSVTVMDSMFYSCKSLTFLDVTGFKTSNVTNMQNMFGLCSSLTSIDVSNFDTSNVMHMSFMFYMCPSLLELDISNFDLRNVQSTYSFALNSGIRKLVLGEYCRFTGDQCLSDISTSGYTGKWIREDGANGSFTSAELCRNYTSDMAGTWVWEKKPSEAYAILQDDGELVLFRADAGLTAGTGKTVTDVSGNTYTGRLYTGIETTNLNNSSNCIWYQQRSSIKSVRIAEGQVIKPINTGSWFMSCSNMTSCDLTGLDTSNVMSMDRMFSGCSKLTSIDLSMLDTSKVTNMSQMFYGIRIPVLNLSNFNTKSVRNMTDMFGQCPDLKELDISSFDTSNTTSMHLMFGYTIGLEKIKLGENFSFKGVGPNESSWATLLTPKDKLYSGKWIRDDKAYGPYTPAELRDNYTPEMAGTWIWELAPVEYTISFEAGENGTGAMQSVNARAKEDFTLPANQFAAFGYDFDHWDDGNGKTYADKGTIPANTYAADTTVTLTAVFKKRDTSLNWDGNEAEFSIRAGEQAVLDNIPAGTSYQVYELTPDGWVLVQQENSSGVIEALEESAASFWNKYQPGVTTVQFSGLKNLDGHPATAGSFTFELYEGDTLVDTATTQDGGFIQFKVIEYDAAGDYVYTIREVDPNDDTIDYDTHEETVEVSVTDNGDGTLSSEVKYDDDGIVFSNATRPGTLRITKDATNGTSQNANDKFTIEIEFRNESGMPINDNIYWYVEGDASPSDIDGGNQE